MSNLKPKLLIATTNAGKVAELIEWLDDLPYEAVCLSDLSSAPPPVEETGETFAANALLKARYYHEHCGWLTLSDDSGLVVAALDGRPGVHSARYAGEGASSSQMTAKLLDEMKGVPDGQRQARFVCAVVVYGNGVQQTFTGVCEGVIAQAPRGAHGFGYDPVFLDLASGRTLAELSRAEKAAISHRGRALRQARDYLKGVKK